MQRPALVLSLILALTLVGVPKAQKTSALPTGPAISPSDYEVIPRQLVTIDVLDHDPASNPYELAWIDAGSAVVTVITSTLVVDADGSRRNIPVAIPSEGLGTRYLETRRNAAQVARSDAVQVIAPRHSYLPLSLTNHTVSYSCPTTSDNQYGSGTAFQAESDDPVRRANSHADKNISLRNYTRNSDPALKRELVDYGSGDTKAPQLATMFNPQRVPSFLAFYRVYDWDWAPSPAPGTRSNPIKSPPVTALGMGTTPGEPLHVPASGYSIGGGLEVIVLFADENTITLNYTREDTAATGYTIHVDRICTDPSLLLLYKALDDAGGPRYVYTPLADRPYTYNLPTLAAGKSFGTARGNEIVVGIVDTGTFQDPRSCNEWWLERPGYTGACPQGP
jgi:hypothetical protein